MGKSASKYVPSYFKNFNIENRAFNKLDKIEHGKVNEPAPRHPSTASRFKELEKMAPKFDDLNSNIKVIEASKQGVKVFSKGDNQTAVNEVVDKRPKKENEIFIYSSERKLDVDYEKYGYSRPENIKPGHLTLRQLDEFLDEYKKTKSIDLIKNFSNENKVNETDLHCLIEYLKPFTKIDKNSKSVKENVGKLSSSSSSAKSNDQETTKVDEVFPNIK